MRHFKLAPFTLAVAMAGILFSTTAFGATKLNYSIFFPAPHKNSVLATEWGKEIEKRTKGEVQVTMFYGGTLTPATRGLRWRGQRDLGRRHVGAFLYDG